MHRAFMVSLRWSVWLLWTFAAFRVQSTSDIVADCPIIEHPSLTDCGGGFLFRVTWFGRLGNNLLQLAQALHVAELTQNEVAIPTADASHSYFNRTFWDFRGTTKQGCQVAKADDFFYSSVCPSMLHKSAFSVAEKRTVLQTHVLPFFQIPIRHSRDSVVIHIRSGDVFTYATPPPTYTQPPFAFYKSILTLPDLKKLRIILCVEDFLNPVVNLLKKEYGRRMIVIKDLHSAIGAILGAKHLVLGQSSFSELLGMMAPNLEAIYIPFCKAREDIYVDHNLQGWGVPGFCFEYDNYITLDEWANTEDQLNLMTGLSIDSVHKFALPV